MGGCCVRIQILSDVHAEFHEDGGQAFLRCLDPTGVDVLVAAGDIGVDGSMVRMLKGLIELYTHVVFVNGNHELYGTNRNHVYKLLDQLQKEHSNFHWLHESSVVIGTQRFIGTTLWFPEQPDNILYENQLNDFRKIQEFRRWVYHANQRAVQYLQKETLPDDIVVTHHVPHPEGIPPQWRGSMINRFFLCDMQSMLRTNPPVFWIHGHTHQSQQYRIGSTLFICNPYGYAGHEENPEFDWRLVVEV